MTETPYRLHSGRPYVIVIGSNFGSLSAAKKLQGTGVDVTLIDRINHHLFQPLLYQIAAGILSPGEITPSTRTIFDGVQNVRVVKGDVTDIDVERQVAISGLGYQTSKWEYDRLLAAADAGQSHSGDDHFTEFIPDMKNIDDAFEIRACVIGVFERIELVDDPAERKRLLTFVIVGVGPIGVELAGQLVELAGRILTPSYHNYNPYVARVVLPDDIPQVLPLLDEHLGRKTQRSLEKVGVIARLGTMVTDVNEEGVTYKSMKDGTEEFIPSFCKTQSVGASVSPLGKMIAEQTGSETDRAGRVVVNRDMTASGYKNVYVVGDMSNRENLPGAAQVAIRGGEYVAENITAEANNRDVVECQSFEYFDKGSMATVSCFSVIAKMDKVEVTGFIGWVLWLTVHLTFPVSFRNRFVSCVSWGLSVLNRNRWQMAFTRQQVYTRNAIDCLTEFNKDKAERDLPLGVHDTRHECRASKNKQLTCR